MNEILDLDVAALSEHLRAKKLSSLEVTRAYLDRISATDDKIRAYITVTDDTALAGATRADHEIAAGNWRGAFHGVPVALKDLVYTKGIRTTAGSKILADFHPEFDATVWQRLQAGGAVLLGKLNLHEFAYGVTSSNVHWGFCRNPYALDHIPGGSSGGSAAAIVAKSAAATIGTDTGGSIRIPAAFSGCVGFKPTWSRVSKYGVIPLANSFDHVGPITRTVRDAALMLNLIAGADRNDSASSHEPVPDYTKTISRELKSVRVGVIRELTDKLSGDVAANFNAALKQLADLGAIVDEVSIPSFPATAIVNAIITWSEALEYHEDWIRERPLDYSDEVRRRLEAAMMTTAVSYVRAQRTRARMLSDALSAIENHDVLAAPGTAITAPKIGAAAMTDPTSQIDLLRDVLRFTSPFDCTGQPALALPTGVGANGLPTSIQIIGRPFDEPAVIRVASAYEAARAPLPAPPL